MLPATALFHAGEPPGACFFRAIAAFLSRVAWCPCSPFRALSRQRRPLFLRSLREKVEVNVKGETRVNCVVEVKVKHKNRFEAFHWQRTQCKDSIKTQFLLVDFTA